MIVCAPSCCCCCCVIFFQAASGADWTYTDLLKHIKVLGNELYDLRLKLFRFRLLHLSSYSTRRAPVDYTHCPLNWKAGGVKPKQFLYKAPVCRTFPPWYLRGNIYPYIRQVFLWLCAHNLLTNKRRPKWEGGSSWQPVSVWLAAGGHCHGGAAPDCSTSWDSEQSRDTS